MPLLYYRGTVRGAQKSMAAFTLAPNQLMGIVSSQEIGNFIIDKIPNSESSYLCFNSADLLEKPKQECLTDETNYSKEYLENIKNAIENGPTKSVLNNCVSIFLECDYQFYQESGYSLFNTKFRITALFNVMATIYQSENIKTYISEIFVWTSDDDYPETDISNTLNAFSIYRINNPFSGNLAHLIVRDAASEGTGVGQIGGLCGYYPFGATGVFEFSPLNNLYSIFIMTHEIGHSLGSNHTHLCIWNGNNTQIDDCGNVWAESLGYIPEGNACFDNNNPILPPSGTIMSYCPLINGSPIILSNGFGQQPGDIIRNTVDNASCLNSCNGCNLDILLTKTDPYSLNNGTAKALAIDGVQPYSYSWNNGSTEAEITNLTGGVYSCYVSDAVGCSASSSIVLCSATAFVQATGATNGNNGSANAFSINGTPPISYSWNIGSSSKYISGLSPGYYSCTISDATGCSTQAGNYVCGYSAYISQTSPTGGANNGTATMNTFNGVPPYSYYWNTGDNNQTISGLSSGLYSCIMSDGTGCSTSATAGLCGLSVSTSGTDASNGNNRQATISGNVGVAPYTYSWNNGNPNQTLSNLSIGTYYCTVTDAIGCTDAGAVTINSCSALTLKLNFDDFPNETSGFIIDQNGLYFESFHYANPNLAGQTVEHKFCIPDGCQDFIFAIYDTEGNGMCCNHGNGSYELIHDITGNIIVSGSDFGGADVVFFDLSPGFSNFENFESGWGIWNDGGWHSRRSVADGTYSNSPPYCVRLRDNTSSSSMTTDNLNFSGYDELTVSFT